MQDLLPSVEQVRDALRVAEAASQKLRISIACSIPIQPCLIDTQEFPRVGFGYCAAGTDRAYYTLDPLGNVRPCNHSPLILGNLFEHTFSELVASENLAGFVASTPIACSNCDKLRICQGGCKAAAQQCYGSLALEEPFLADARRMISPGPVG
jgi:radical SAM protein with 4Fe4S-binding SPASM domain